MLEADKLIIEKSLSLSIMSLGVNKVEPILLITVLKFSKVFPVRAHHLFIVVLDEGLEHLRLFLVAGVDLREESIDKKSLYNYGRFLLPYALA